MTFLRRIQIQCLMLLVFWLPASIEAQTDPPGTEAIPAPQGAQVTQTAEAAEAIQSVQLESSLPREYRSIRLGMDSDEVAELLSADPWFDYRGEPDISLLERPRASIIDSGGSLFLSRGLFQFEDEKLIAIVLELNSENVDWFSVFTTLNQRYGAPFDMDPSKSWWEDERTRLALERPLTVKYLDLEYFDAMAAEKSNRAAWRQKAREDFLDAF